MFISIKHPESTNLVIKQNTRIKQGIVLCVASRSENVNCTRSHAIDACLDEE